MCIKTLFLSSILVLSEQFVIMYECQKQQQQIKCLIFIKKERELNI